MSWVVPGYLEIRELGRGASGRVVVAEHEATGTLVAIKYLADRLSQDASFVQAFRDEARILSEVEDPQIAQLYEYVESPHGAAIVMELVDGVALRAMLREHGPTEPTAALVVLKGSLLGLAAAHDRHVVHRDYKPENVLVDRAGHSKLADFGIAAREGTTGVLAGTPSYMAPEQWAGSTASPSTDIYAATATFFECLAGHPPYRASGDLMGLRRLHEEAPIPVQEVPEEVRGLVRRGLAKKTGQRPGDAHVFLTELEAVAGAGYGPEWEREGRGELARRAALLLLLFPLAAAAAGGTGAVKTILGVSKKVFSAAVAGGTALVLATAGLIYVLATAQQQVSPPAAITQSPSATASPSPSPSPTQSPTPRRTLQPSPAPSPTPVNVVHQLAVSRICWSYDTKCISSAPTNTQSAAQQQEAVMYAWIGITTETGGPVKLRLRYVIFDDAVEIGEPLYDYVEVPAGDRTQLLPPHGTNLYELCSNYQSGQIKLTVEAEGLAGPVSRPSYTYLEFCGVG